jgi:hypothetical protein
LGWVSIKKIRFKYPEGDPISLKKSISSQKWTWPDGKVTEYRKVEGGAIGKAFDIQGRLLTCETGNKRVTRDPMRLDRSSVNKKRI